ncbi:hypothetical protein V496_07716, partial [Pseudogymnoascus sp. VKM F-4515 (FW-2607)]
MYSQVLISWAYAVEIAALTAEDPATSQTNAQDPDAPLPPSSEPTNRTPEQLASDIERTLSARDASVARTAEIIQKADSLRTAVTLARASITSCKAELVARTRALEKARNGLSARQQKALDDLAKASKMSTYRWNHAHALTVQHGPGPRRAAARPGEPVSVRASACGDHPPARGLPPPHHLLHRLVVLLPPCPVPGHPPVNPVAEREQAGEHAWPDALPSAGERVAAAPAAAVCQDAVAAAGEGGSGSVYCVCGGSGAGG